MRGTSPESAAKARKLVVSSPATVGRSRSLGRPPPPSAKRTTGARALLAEERAVDGAKSADDSIGRALRAQLVFTEALSLRRHRVGAVFDEALGVCEVLDVLSRGALARLAAPGHGLGAAGIGERAQAVVQLLQRRELGALRP